MHYLRGFNCTHSKKGYVLEQRKIRYKELFGFGANPQKASELFAHFRVLGYARAITGGFVERVRIFSPNREFAYMSEDMIKLGVPKDRIVHQETSVTTYHNAIKMRRVLAELDLKDHEVCMSSSVYHGRTQFFGKELHGLELVFVPAEAFYLASLAKPERLEAIELLIRRFGDGPLTRLIVDDTKGIAETLLGEYVVPPQPQD